MMSVPSDTLRQLERFDTCTVSNAIEHFQIRTRNEGFVNGSLRCIFPQLSPRVGYAAPARIRTSATPITGRCYYDRPEWWSFLLTIPEPRFIVAKDVDHYPGMGALFGEIHANISRALGCTAYITNGAIRDLPGVEAAGLQVFAHSIAPSHAYAHIVDFGEPVEIGGLQVKAGDLLHCDQHGIVSVPTSIAGRIPKIAQDIQEAERGLIEFCRSTEFSSDNLPDRIHRLSARLKAARDSTK
jgi:4-hydroxy-4-methyl-2-oxoglutarate aldolase